MKKCDKETFEDWFKNINLSLLLMLIIFIVIIYKFVSLYNSTN